MLSIYQLGSTILVNPRSLFLSARVDNILVERRFVERRFVERRFLSFYLSAGIDDILVIDQRRSSD